MSNSANPEHKIKWLELGPDSIRGLSKPLNKGRFSLLEPRLLLGVKGPRAIEMADAVKTVLKEAVQKGNDPDLPLRQTKVIKGSEVIGRVNHPDVVPEFLSLVKGIERPGLGKEAEVVIFCRPKTVNETVFEAAIETVITRASRALKKQGIEPLTLPNGEQAFDVRSIPGIDLVNLD